MGAPTACARPAAMSGVIDNLSDVIDVDFGPDPSQQEGGDAFREENTEVSFPLDSLPSPMREMVAEVARIHQVPTDLPGSMALATVSAALGQGILLDNPPHQTPPGLFVLATACSGTGKSAAYSNITAPLFRLQARLIAAHSENELPRLSAEKQLLGLDVQRLKTAKPRTPEERGEVLDSLQRANAELAKIEESLLPPRLLVEDATPPKLAALLAANRETLGVFSAEAGDIVSNWQGRHNATGRTDETLFLKGFSRDPHSQDRVGTGTIQLLSPCLSMLIVTTPDEAANLFDNERFRVGGLLARFLICAPDARWQRDNGEGRRPDDLILSEWNSLIVSLAESFRLRTTDAHMVTATQETLELLRHLKNDYADRFDELKEQAAFAARHVEYASRIALVLHCVRHREKAGLVPLDKPTMEAGVSLLRYYTAQQGRMLAKGIEAARMKRLGDLLEALGRYPNISATVADLGRRNGFRREEIQKLADLFPERIKITEERGSKGGRPATVVSIP